MNHLKPALVKICRNGEFRGNGFLAEGGWVVTCAHVVADALGCDPAQPSLPQGEVDVVFHWVDGEPKRKARVQPGGWFPANRRQDGLYDIAILALAASAPDTVRPLVPAGGERERYRAVLHPFIPSAGDSIPIDGEVGGPTSNRRMVLRASDAYSQFIEKGVSGSAVFAGEGDQVEGIVEMRDSGVRQALLCPGSVLRQALAALPRGSDTGSHYLLVVDEDRTRFANRKLATFYVWTPTQENWLGLGVPAFLSVSFEPFDPDKPCFTEVVVHVTPPRSVDAPRGFADPFVSGKVVVICKGDPRYPRWRLTAADGATLSDCDVFVEDPPLFVLANPVEGEEVRAKLTVFAGRMANLPPEDGETTMRQRILDRLSLQELGDIGSEGEIVLGEIVSVVKAKDAPNAGG